jgi:hypothetical protein
VIPPFEVTAEGWSEIPQFRTKEILTERVGMREIAQMAEILVRLGCGTLPRRTLLHF